jgi:hypothetical protein
MTDPMEPLLCNNCGYEADEVSSNDLCDTCFDAWTKGVEHERARLTKILWDKEVIRDSMLGKDLLVIYSINGALDIARKDIGG